LKRLIWINVPLVHGQYLSVRQNLQQFKAARSLRNASPCIGATVRSEPAVADRAESDIHADLEAREACLSHARNRGAERCALLGDFGGTARTPPVSLP
jgi:hypothetical protein